MEVTPEEQSICKEFLDYVNGCHSEFHAVSQTENMLKKAGFVQISEKVDSDWSNLKPGGKYYFTRNQSSVMAFAVGGQYKPGNGFSMAGAHTDSPVLKIKPLSKTSGSGFLQIPPQVGIEPYGGGLWNTWFDRNLTVAGRAIVEGQKDGKTVYECKLVHIPRPILCIPNLAIHLNRNIYTEGFKYNKQTHLLPILATEILTGKPDEKSSGEHHTLLVDLLAKELKVSVEAAEYPSVTLLCRPQVSPDKIKDFDLGMCDTQPACIHGAKEEFISARGLDNLMMSFICTKSLIDST
eukprot:1392651-Amorphochlora_amoeboformis.AAC.1